MMYKLTVSVVCVAMLAGCSGQPGMIDASSTFSGKLTAADGAPVSHVLVTLQPLGTGHPVILEVDASGNFHGEGVPGEYAYFVARSFKASSSGDAWLKKVPAEYREASMARKVKIGDSPQMDIVLQ